MLQDILTPGKDHNHGLEDYPQLSALKNLLKKRVTQDKGQSSKRQLFDSVTREHPQGTQITFPQIERSLHRAQRRSQPRVPQTAEDACVLLQTENAGPFALNLRMVTDDADGNIAIIFHSDEAERLLPSIEEVSYDSTFYVVPSQFYQIFVLHGFCYGHYFPLVFALMTCKSTLLYKKVFEYIKNQFPTFSPKTAMSDFEAASSDAFEAVFENVEVTHCHFHYSQCIWRKVQKAGLTTLYREDTSFKAYIKKIMSFPFLPENVLVNTANLVLDQDYTPDAENRPKVSQLKQYVKRFWLTKMGPKKISVFAVERGTNDAAESFHGRLKARIQSHKPNFWSFLQHLNECIADSENDIERAEGGLQISRRRTAKVEKNFRRRAECKEKLSNNIYTPLQYLAAVSYTTDPSLLNTENLDRLEMETDVQEEEQEEEGGDTGDTERCVICLGPRNNVKILLPCGHGGCGACIDRLVSERSTCHVCRAAITGSVQAFL